MTIHRAVPTFAALVLLCPVAGCDPGEETTLCADPAEVVILPSPAWLAGGTLAAPEGDAAAAILDRHRPDWVELLGAVDGWPSRPTIVVPLSGEATGVDPAGLYVYADAGGGMAEQALGLHARLEGEGRSLVIEPLGSAPPGARELVVAIAPGAVEGARPLPACGASSEPDPDYEAARRALPSPEEVELAVRVPLSAEPEALGRLGDALAAAPVLTVAEVEARTLESFASKAPSEEVAALLRAEAASGILSLPDYRDDGGSFELDAEGVPVPQGETRPGFVVALPLAGEPPFPFVLFQHGGGQDKADFFALAGPLAEAGFAFIGIDLPAHGDRAGASAGGDLDILDFEDPVRTRDNLRQAAADHVAVLTGVAAINDALEGALGVADALDPDRAFYMGLSLGGITGSLTFTSAPELRGAALFVGGGYYPELLSQGLFRLLIMDILDAPALESAVVMGLLETILDGADPSAYGLRAEDRTRPPRPVVFMQAVGDPIVSEAASDLWALAFGADLALPSHHPVTGMEELSLPASDNFTWPGGGESATRLLVQAPMEEVVVGAKHGGLILQPYSQELVARCFSTILESGSCEVVDTGFALH